MLHSFFYFSKVLVLVVENLLNCFGLPTLNALLIALHTKCDLKKHIFCFPKLLALFKKQQIGYSKKRIFENESPLKVVVKSFYRINHFFLSFPRIESIFSLRNIFYQNLDVWKLSRLHLSLLSLRVIIYLRL